MITAALLVVGLVGWYASEALRVGHLLRGGSLPGLVCGVAAGAIIAFEMLLWPRKIFRSWRLIAAKHWLAAHLWLGLASLPLAYVHCGFHTGGLLPTLFLIIFTLTILSGILGWVLQHVIPKLILKSVPAETICSQIPRVSEQNRESAYSLLLTLIGPPSSGLELASPDTSDRVTLSQPAQANSNANGKEQLSLGNPAPEYRPSKTTTVVLETVRSSGPIKGRTVRTANLVIDPKHSPALWDLYFQIEPYLRLGRRSRSELSDPRRSSMIFSSVRSQCGPTCHEIIDSLEEYCEERRQFDVQVKLNAWLHGWLPFHIGMSVAVTILLIGHIVTALRY